MSSRLVKIGRRNLILLQLTIFLCGSLHISNTIAVDNLNESDSGNYNKIPKLRTLATPALNNDPFQKVYEDLGIMPDNATIPSVDYNILGKLRDNENDYQQVWTPWLSRAAVHVAKVSDDGEFFVVGGGYLLDTELHIYRWNDDERKYLKVWEAGSGIITRDIYDVAFGDSDNNNLIEIAAACADGRVYLFEQAHISDPIANLENRFDFVWKSDNFFQATAVEFFDLDLDGDEDLVVGSWDKKVHIFESTDHSGYPFDVEHWIELTERWNSTELDDKIQSLGVGDFNDNGLPDFIVGTLSGSIYIFENDGTVMAPHGIEFPFPNDNDYRLIWNNSGVYQPIWNPIGQIATGELNDGDNATEAVLLAWGQGAWILHYTDDRDFYLEQLIQEFEVWQMTGAYPFENFADWMVRAESMNRQVYHEYNRDQYNEPWNFTSQNFLDPVSNSAVTGAPTHSENGGVLFNGNEYRVYYTSKVSWSAAKTACEAQGGHLVTITSPEENEFVTDLVAATGLTGVDLRVSIGLTDANAYSSEGIFLWSTGDIASYTNWYTGKPTPSGDEDYVELMGDLAGLWNDIALANTRYYVCEWDNYNGGTLFNGHEYKAFASAITWTAAKLACESLGGHLVTITSNAENNFVWNLVGGNVVWLGFTDSETYGATEGNWEWITGESVTYTNWRPGEPNNYLNIEDFAAMYSDNRWNDLPSSYNRYYVCEWDYLEEKHTTFTTGIDHGGVLSDGHEYKVFSNPVNWTIANTSCVTMGGNLVTITSLEEFEVVQSLLNGGRAWIGLTNATTEGTWEWLTGENVTFTAWAENEPNGGSAIDTVEQYQNGWYDTNSSFNRAFICEWDHTPMYATGTWNLGAGEELASNGNDDPDLYIIFEPSANPDPNEWNISLSNNLIDWHQINTTDISPLTQNKGLAVDVDPLFAKKRMMSAQYVRLTLLQGNSTEFKTRRVNAILFPFVARPLTIAASVTIDSLSFSYYATDNVDKILFGGTDGRLLAFQYEPHNIFYYKKSSGEEAKLTEIPATDYGITNPSFNQIWDSYTDSYFNLGETIWSIQGTPKKTYIPSWRYELGITDEFVGGNFANLHHLSVYDLTGNPRLLVTETTGPPIEAYDYDDGAPVPDPRFNIVNSVLSGQQIFTLAFGDLYQDINDEDELIVFPWNKGPFRRPDTYDPSLLPEVWKISTGQYQNPVDISDLEIDGHLYDFLADSTTFPSGTIVDVNNDSLQDIIISNGRLAILWNIGTASNPEFKFDFNYFEEFNDRAPPNPIFSPNAWDYDQDGDYDIAYSYQSSSHGGVFYLGNEYKLFYDAKTWTEAKAACQALGGHLVTVNDSAENTFVNNLAGYNRIYIGLTDELQEGVWKWVTGESFSYTNWSPLEPNNLGGEDYVEMYYNGLWNDLPSSHRRYYVCEWEAGQTGFRYGMDFFENQGTFEEPQWVRNAYVMKNPTTDGSLRFNNYTFGVIVPSTSNESSAESLWVWNGVLGHIRNLIAETDQQNSYILGTNPELIKLEVNLRQSPPDAINYGYSVVKSWSNSEELNDWTLTLATSYGLDGDGSAEIIVCDYDNNVYVFEHLIENTYKRAYKTHDLNHTETTNFSPYAFQDLPGVSGTFRRTIYDHGNLLSTGLDFNNNGNEEFIIAAGFKIYIFEATGFNDEFELIFETDFSDFIFDKDVDQFTTLATTPDFDGRGSMIALGVSNQLFLLRWDPVIGWIESFQSTGGGFGFYNQPGNPNYHPDLDIRTMLFADLNQDNKTELWMGGTNLTGIDTGFVLALQSDFGNIHQFYEFNRSISTCVNAFVTSDSDFDGKLELIIAHTDGIDIWEAENSEIFNFTRTEIISSDPNYGNDNNLVETFGTYESSVGLAPRAHDILRLVNEYYFVIYGVEEENHNAFGIPMLVNMSDPTNGDGRLYYSVTSDPSALGTAKNITKQLFNAPEDLLISEIFYQELGDEDNTSFHWIELYNPNVFEVSLVPYTIGIDTRVNIILSGSIPAREYLIIAQSTSVFSAKYTGLVPDIQDTSLEFTTDDTVKLYKNGEEIDSVTGGLHTQISSFQRKNQSNTLNTAYIPLDTDDTFDWRVRLLETDHPGTPYERNYDKDDGIDYGIEYEPSAIQLQNGTIFVSWIHAYNTSYKPVVEKCILARNFDESGNSLTKTRLIANITVGDPSIQVQGLGTLEIHNETDQILYLGYTTFRTSDYQGNLILQVIQNGESFYNSTSLGLKGYFIHSVDLINFKGRLGIIFAGYPRDAFYLAQQLYFTILNSTYYNQGVFPITSGVGSAQFPCASAMENYPNRIAVTYERIYLHERLVGGQSEVFSVFSSDSGTTWSDSYVLDSDDPYLDQTPAGLVTEGGYNVINRQNYRPRVTDDGTGGILYQFVSRFLVNVSDVNYYINEYNSSHNLATQLWIGKIERGHWFKFTDIKDVRAIAVGDTDNDLRNELFISHDYRVSLLEITEQIDGSISYIQKWQYQPPSYISLHPELINSTYAQFFASEEARTRETGAVAIFDANGNGWPELIFSLRGGDVFSFEITNLDQPINDKYAITEEYLFNNVTFVSSSSINASDNLLIDVNEDGDLDLIVADGQGENGLTAWDIEENELLWRYTTHSIIGKIYFINNSLVVGITTEGVFGVDLDGNELYWIPGASLNNTSNHAFTDVNDDAVPDLIVATKYGIYAIEPLSGEIIWDVVPDNNPQKKGYFDLAVGSIGQTTRISVCSSDFSSYKNVTILGSDGSIINSLSLTHLTKFDTRSRSAIGDFDGNLQLDLAIAIFDNYANESRLEVYELSNYNLIMNKTIPIAEGLDLSDFTIYARDVDDNSIADIILPILIFDSKSALFPSKGYSSAIFAIDVSTSTISWQRHFTDTMVKFEIEPYGDKEVLLAYMSNSGLFAVSLSGADILWSDLTSHSVAACIANDYYGETYNAVTSINGTGPVFKVTGMLSKASNIITPQISYVKTHMEILYTDLATLNATVIPVIVTSDGTERVLIAFNNGTLILRSFDRGEIWRIQVSAFSQISACGLEIEPGTLGLAFKTDTSDLFILERTTTQVWAQVMTEGSIVTSLSLDGSSDVLLLQTIAGNSSTLTLFDPITKTFVWTYNSPAYFTYLNVECLDASNIGIKTHIVALDYLGNAHLIELPSTLILGGVLPAPFYGSKWVLAKSVENNDRLADVILSSDGGDLIRYRWLSNGGVSIINISDQNEIVSIDVVDQGAYNHILLNSRNKGSQVWRDDGSTITFVSELHHSSNDSIDHHFANIDDSDTSEIALIVHNSLIFFTAEGDIIESHSFPEEIITVRSWKVDQTMKVAFITVLIDGTIAVADPSNRIIIGQNGEAATADFRDRAALDQLQSDSESSTESSGSKTQTLELMVPIFLTTFATLSAIFIGWQRRQYANNRRRNQP